MLELQAKKLAFVPVISCAWALAFAIGCTDPAPTPGGGSEETGGSGGTGGRGGAGGSSSTGTGGQGGAGKGDASDGGQGDASDDGQLNCPLTTVANANITDFSDWSATGTWGAAPGLTGRSFVYPTSKSLTATLVTAEAGDTDDAANTADVSITDDAESGDAGNIDVANISDVAHTTGSGAQLRVTGRIAAGQSAGIGFDFDPVCTDASPYGGIAFTMSGTSGNAQALMLVKTDDDVPMTGSKGHCPETDGVGCVLPSKTFVVPAPAGSVPIVLGWAGFMGGQPTMGVDHRTLLGVEWEFDCPALDGAPDCVVDVTLDDVRFVDSLPPE